MDTFYGIDSLFLLNLKSESNKIAISRVGCLVCLESVQFRDRLRHDRYRRYLGTAISMVIARRGFERRVGGVLDTPRRFWGGLLSSFLWDYSRPLNPSSSLTIPIIIKTLFTSVYQTSNFPVVSYIFIGHTAFLRWTLTESLEDFDGETIGSWCNFQKGYFLVNVLFV